MKIPVKLLPYSPQYNKVGMNFWSRSYSEFFLRALKGEQFDGIKIKKIYRSPMCTCKDLTYKLIGFRLEKIK